MSADQSRGSRPRLEDALLDIYIACLTAGVACLYGAEGWWVGAVFWLIAMVAFVASGISKAWRSR